MGLSPDRVYERQLQLSKKLEYHLFQDPSDGLPTALGDQISKRKKGRGELEIRLDRLEELGLNKHLPNSQPIERVALEQLNHVGVKQLANGIEPFANVGNRRGAGSSAAPPADRRVVEETKTSVHALKTLDEFDLLERIGSSPENKPPTNDAVGHVDTQPETIPGERTTRCLRHRLGRRLVLRTSDCRTTPRRF